MPGITWYHLNKSTRVPPCITKIILSEKSHQWKQPSLVSEMEIATINLLKILQQEFSLGIRQS